MLLRKRALAAVAAIVLSGTYSAAHLVATASVSRAAPVPFGVGANLVSIAFGDASHGWAVGSDADVTSTADGGVNWTSEFAGGGVQQLTGVAAVSATMAWIVGSMATTAGSAGVVLATTDGSTWTPQTTPVVAGLNGVSFVNSTSGWAVGYVAPGGVNVGAILGTVDGGAHWNFQPVPAGITDVNAVSFVDASHGWATASTPTGDTVIVTSDGGMHWSTESVPAGIQLRAIDFRDTMHGWVAGGTPSTTGNPAGLVLATTNGGATWTAQTLPPNFLTLSGIAFASTTVGWAVGGRELFGQPGSEIASTTNGGNTWTSQNAPLTSDLVGIAAISTTAAWSVGYGPCQNPSIVATTDGATWTERLDKAPFLTSLAAVTSVDSTHAWAVGTDSCGLGAILTTTNVTSWTASELPGGVGDLLGVSFADVAHGWAVGLNTGTGPAQGGLMLATTDGGQTWQPQSIPSNIGALRAVHFVSSTTGWAVGTNNAGGQAVIIATTDGGGTWTAESAPAGFVDLNGVWFADSSHGWATGFAANGGVIATTDGGAAWSAQTVPAGSNPVAVDFVDANNGWIVGMDQSSFAGEVLNSSNGGATWTRQNPPSAANYNAVSFANSSAGWAVGQGTTSAGVAVGVVSATTDGGGTWGGQGQNWASVLNGVSAASASTAWAVGVARGQGPYGNDAATIIDTTDGGAIWDEHSYTFPPMALQTVLPALANGAYGGYTTAAYVENVGQEPASAEIKYFDAGGAPSHAMDATVIEPNTTWVVRQDDGNSFLPGKAGWGAVIGSQPLVAFVNEFAPGGGDATSYTGITSTNVGTTLFASAIANNAYGGYTTGIGLVNVGGTSTSVTVTYRDASGATIKTQTLSGLAAGAYQGLFSGDAALGLPAGFAGTATIASSGSLLAAVVNETGPGGQFSSYDAVASGSTTLYAPAALNNAYGGYFTGMGIQNTSGSPGTVTVDYYNSGGVATTKTFSIAAQGYLGVYQGSTADGPAAGAYTARITASVPIVAIVTEVAPSITSAKQSTSYNTVDAGGSFLILPLVENAGADGWSTGEGIMNTGSAPTTVTVTYFDAATGVEIGTPQSQLLQPRAYWGLYQPAGGLPVGGRANAVVTTSTGGQVAVICNESSATTFMSYDGQ
jgi:photosystem II stability/assembly factor-like uncharacterized protein